MPPGCLAGWVLAGGGGQEPASLCLLDLGSPPLPPPCPGVSVKTKPRSSSQLSI